MADERAGGDSPKLPWPPLPEDLRRLYLEEGLSASKIAKVYGLEYASAKTAESTVLYHLKKNGIARREAAAHIRKVTAKMVDQWVVRYQSGESLKQIAGDSVGPVTVFNHLRKRGIQLRDRLEAQIKATTKHQRHPFDGGDQMRAYLIGLVKGDFYVTRHGRAIRVKTGTTHPKMTELVRSIFSRHGAIYVYPRVNRLVGYEWSIDCDLDDSYEFLLEIDRSIPVLLRDERLFWSFLAGFFDAEGNIYFHKKGTRGAFELTISNTNEPLIKEIFERLRTLAFGVKLTLDSQSKGRIEGTDEGIIWRIRVWRYRDVVGMLQKLGLRHPEKVEATAIVLSLQSRANRTEVESTVFRWNEFRKQVKRERDEYLERAARTIFQRKGSKTWNEA